MKKIHHDRRAGAFIWILLFFCPIYGWTADATLKLGHVAPIGSLYDLASSKFAERVSANTSGKVTIKVFGNSQFGSLHEHWAQVKVGAIDMHMIDIGAANMIEQAPKNFSVLMAPYLFDSQKKFHAFVRSDLFAAMMAKVEKSHHIKYIGYVGDNAPRGFSTTNRKVVSLENMKGLKLRVPQVPMFISIFRAWGATPTPVAPKEVYTSIKSGMVDGMEQNMFEIYLAKYHEIQKYYIALDYLRSGIGCWINADSWNSLPNEIKKSIQQSVEETAAFINELTANQVHEAKKAFKTAGVEIIQPELRPWKAIAEKQVLKFEGKLWDKGLYNKIKTQQ